MEFTTLDFWLITLFNTVVCLSFPRLIALNWSNIFSKNLLEFKNLYQPQMEVVEETGTKT